MADEERHGKRDQDRVLGAIAAGSSMLLVGSVVFVVLTQALGPAFGLQVGSPSETVLIAMLVSGVTGGSAVTIREFLRRYQRNDDER